MTCRVGTRVSHYKAVERLSTSRRVETRVISYKDVEALNPLSVVKLVRHNNMLIRFLTYLLQMQWVMTSNYILLRITYFHLCFVHKHGCLQNVYYYNASPFNTPCSPLLSLGLRIHKVLLFAAHLLFELNINYLLLVVSPAYVKTSGGGKTQHFGFRGSVRSPSPTELGMWLRTSKTYDTIRYEMLF